MISFHQTNSNEINKVYPVLYLLNIQDKCYTSGNKISQATRESNFSMPTEKKTTGKTVVGVLYFK